MYSLTFIIHQVYQVLDKHFADCPWPVPPSAILMHLPIEEIPGVKTREEVLRDIIGFDMKWRKTVKWQFQNVTPYPDIT